MHKFFKYLKEYLDVYGSSSGKMGSASKDMRKKYKKALLKQTGEKKSPYAKKEVKNLLKFLK